MSVKAEHLRTPEEALGMPQVQVSELAHRVPRCTPEVKILEPSSFLCILLSTKFHADKILENLISAVTTKVLVLDTNTNIKLCPFGFLPLRTLSRNMSLKEERQAL